MVTFPRSPRLPFLPKRATVSKANPQIPKIPVPFFPPFPRPAMPGDPRPRSELRRGDELEGRGAPAPAFPPHPAAATAASKSWSAFRSANEPRRRDPGRHLLDAFGPLRAERGRTLGFSLFRVLREGSSLPHGPLSSVLSPGPTHPPACRTQWLPLTPSPPASSSSRGDSSRAGQRAGLHCACAEDARSAVRHRGRSPRPAPPRVSMATRARAGLRGPSGATS